MIPILGGPGANLPGLLGLLADPRLGTSDLHNVIIIQPFINTQFQLQLQLLYYLKTQLQLPLQLQDNEKSELQLQLLTKV